MMPGPMYCALCLHLEGVHLDGCQACAMIDGSEADHGFDSGQPRAFALLRHTDATGVSGTGLVMQGVEFVDGRVAARWVTTDAPRSTVLWDSYEDWWQVHVAPHGGATVLFSDGERYDYTEPSRSQNPEPPEPLSSPSVAVRGVITLTRSLLESRHLVAGHDGGDYLSWDVGIEDELREALDLPSA